MYSRSPIHASVMVVSRRSGGALGRGCLDRTEAEDEGEDAVGEGADRDMRGRMCSPERFAAGLGEHAGPSAGRRRRRAGTTALLNPSG